MSQHAPLIIDIAGTALNTDDRRRLAHPLANLIATGQAQSGDKLTVDFEAGSGGLLFFRESRTAAASGELSAAA